MIYHCPWCRAIYGDDVNIVKRHQLSEEHEIVTAICGYCGHIFTITLHIECRLELKRFLEIGSI